MYPAAISSKALFWRVGVMAAFPNNTIKCRYEMLLKDKIITLSIFINRKQAGKPHYYWSYIKNPVTEVTGKRLLIILLINCF